MKLQHGGPIDEQQALLRKAADGLAKIDHGVVVLGKEGDANTVNKLVLGVIGLKLFGVWLLLAAIAAFLLWAALQLQGIESGPPGS